MKCKPAEIAKLEQEHFDYWDMRTAWETTRMRKAYQLIMENGLDSLFSHIQKSTTAKDTFTACLQSRRVTSVIVHLRPCAVLKTDTNT